MDDECKQYSVNLSAYFDGELKGRETTLLVAHLESCPYCQKRLAEYKTLRRSLIAMATHTGTKRSLSKDIMSGLDKEDEHLPC